MAHDGRDAGRCAVLGRNAASVGQREPRVPAARRPSRDGCLEPKPTREVLYLGDNVQQFDMLGRSTPAEQQGREQAIEVGPTPTFVLGLHEAITRWRMNVQFETNQVPSIFSKPHHNSLTFKNFFPQGVGGIGEDRRAAGPDARDAAARHGNARPAVLRSTAGRSNRRRRRSNWRRMPK